MNEWRLSDIRKAKGYHILPVKPGMQLELHEKVGEGSNIRTWRFKGLVIKVRKPNHPDGTFIIRGKTAGHTIEKIYPLSFPKFEKVLLLDSYKVRRAKLYYIREKVGKDAKMSSLLRNEEKGIDLLTLATDEAKELQAAYAAATPSTTSSDDSAVQNDSPEAVVEDAPVKEIPAEKEEEVRVEKTEEVTSEAPVEEKTEEPEAEVIEEAPAKEASEEEKEETQE